MISFPLMIYTEHMKTIAAIVIPAAGILAALGALASGVGTAAFMLAIAAAAFLRFALTSHK